MYVVVMLDEMFHLLPPPGHLDFGDSHFAQVEHVFHIWAFFEMRAKEKVRELKIAVCLVTRNEHLYWKYAYFSK